MPNLPQTLPLRRDGVIALLLFLVASSVYFATITGITSSNDGSTFAHVRALVEDGSIEISPYLDLTENQDYAIYDGRAYSERQPAAAIIAAPFYALSRVMPAPRVELPSTHDRGNPGIPYAVASASIAAGIAVAWFYLLLRRHMGISRPGAVLAAVTLAFGTTTWRYGAVLYSHALAQLCVVGAFHLIFTVEDSDDPRPWLTFFASSLIGLAFMAEYHAGIFSAVAGIALAAVVLPKAIRGLNSGDRARWIGTLAGLALGVGIMGMWFAWYNMARFGTPIAFSYNYLDPARWADDQITVANQFQVPLSVGLPGMLWTDGLNQGLFLLAPAALLGIPGLYWWFADLRREGKLWRGLAIMAAFTLSLLFFATSITYNAFTNDSRYLASFMALWFIPVAVTIDRYFRALDAGPRPLLSLLVYGLIAWSIRNQAWHIVYSWNYDFHTGLLKPLAINLEVLRLMIAATLFRNAPNLPILWSMYGAAAVVVGGGWWLLRGRE